MRFTTSACAALTGLVSFSALSSASIVGSAAIAGRNIEYVIKPKVFIISMFSYEEEAWQGIPEFNLYTRNITVPGFSPLYPDAHCTGNGDICQVTTGESGQ